MYSVNVPERRYTAGELLEHARGQGTPASDRLIDDWVRKGLIDRPQAPGRGQGGGRAPGTWTWDQLRLFLLVLRKRRDEVKRVLTLCNIPVAIWMYYGDQYVPLRQVRRALSTWSASYTYVSEAAAKRGARRLVDQLPKTRRAARTELMEIIAKAAYLGKVDRPALVDALAAALDPDRSGHAVGPPGATLTPENSRTSSRPAYAQQPASMTSPTTSSDELASHKSASSTHTPNSSPDASQPIPSSGTSSPQRRQNSSPKTHAWIS